MAYQSVKGTNDTLPSKSYQWHYIEDIFRKSADLFGYKELRTPIFEKTEVFSRSLGEETDIVGKEMYTFEDKGGDMLTLRPEMTAALVRSVIQHSLANEVSDLRLWYFGPFFRRERAQKGRYRQFHQFGAECISSPNPEADVEVIQLAVEIINRLGIDDYKLLLNSIGNTESRKVYKEELVKYLKSHNDKLSADSRNRLEKNPLRVLDSKDSGDREVVENAPVILDYLDDVSKSHFDQVKNLLDQLGIPYEIEDKLVRGLDYYCHTVFEFQSTALGAQNSFGGGGRYDGLFSQLGGKDTPAVGFAMGVERLLLIVDEIGKMPRPEPDCEFYIVNKSEKNIPVSFKIQDILRRHCKSVISDLQRRSVKGQFKESGKLNAPYTITIHDDYPETGKITLKHFDKGIQEDISLEELENYKFD
jgi:histidyl-tRNA synthetase